MSRSAAQCRPVRTRTSSWVTLCLVAGAGSFIAWVAMAFSREDIEAVESPLALVVARQLESSAGGLYGPYGATESAGPDPCTSLLSARDICGLAALARGVRSRDGIL